MFTIDGQFRQERRMLDSHYHPVARTTTDFVLKRNAFYAISLRHLWLVYGF